jgi:hypothetical protein
MALDTEASAPSDSRLCPDASGFVLVADTDARCATAPTAPAAPGARHSVASSEHASASVLRWLRRRKDPSGRPLLTAVQVEAGERLAADFLRGQLMPRVTADWSQSGANTPKRRGIPGHGVEVREGTSAAQDRFRSALNAVEPEFADMLINICCFDIGLEDVEKALSWPKRSGKVLLQVGLNQLARHYGMIPTTHATHVLSQIRHVGVAGYKPTLDADG